MAELSDRPFPPGDYPVVVVGSGPGGLQASYSLRSLGVPHAVLSADPAPGGMFRRWPFFQRLLSWTKPFAPEPRGTRAYERYDWNSLIPDDDAHRSIQAELMDGSISYFPSRPEMEASISTFANRTGLTVRYGCCWESTRRLDDGRFELTTSDGAYTAATLVMAIGVAEPWRPQTAGMELAGHYADTRPAESYADRRVFIIGKQNSGFELASGLLSWARRIIIASPSPTKLSVNTHSLVGIRARYLQPYEDHALGGGVGVLDASIEAIEHAPNGSGLVVRTRPSSGGPGVAYETDEVIAATGFIAPLRDLPALGVATFGQSLLPAQTAYWESASVPGIFFAGTVGQGAKGLRKHGIPANSGAVQGARYNARCLAAYLARTRFGVEPERPAIAASELAEFVAEELTCGPEIWHQRAYLARIVGLDPTSGIRDEGIVPLATFVDDAGSDALAITLEADGSTHVYPVLYSRVGGRLTEHRLEPDPLLDYRTESTRREIDTVLALFGAGTISGA
ncbi:MAG: NAD(P)-binding domain-containing protein [Chloroflexota bacterium]|nr:NAD(P)-binding domain-containing protein [Chloroflexota bacterium]